VSIGLCMPSAPSRPCSKPGCKELAYSRFCSEHSTPENLSPNDTHRGSSCARGYDAQWRKIRLSALERDKYLCQHCLPRPVEAIDVHHEVPITTDPSRRLDLTNLTSLCKLCHSKITKGSVSPSELLHCRAPKRRHNSCSHTTSKSCT
jgi:5-methylcytosine-specific restriction protein A